ncbi:MAG: HAD domain-containing protein [Candidatus Berkiella sp.]
MLEGPSKSKDAKASEVDALLSNPILRLSVNDDSAVRFKGTESTEEDFLALLKNLEAKFKTASQVVTSTPNDELLGKDQLIIFLDVDGVCWVDPLVQEHKRLTALDKFYELSLVIAQYWDLLNENYDFLNQYEFLKTACWDPHHMQRIFLLCKEFNARIVVSSSWRKGRNDLHLKNLLDLWGLGSYYLGKTEEFGFISCRTKEIQLWLSNNPLVKRFLILEDQYVENMKKMFPLQFVQCEKLVGFDEATYQNARQMILALSLEESNKSQQKTVLSL